LDPTTLCLIEPLSCWAINFPFHDAAPSKIADCSYPFLGMCLVVPEQQTGGVFGFAEFISGFALLLLIFTVSEVRYRFRVEAAAVHMYSLTFWLAALIGLGALATDVWFAQKYPLPSFLSRRVVWQAVFGALFLLLILGWLWSGFVRPTIFGRFNRFNFTRRLFFYLLHGDEKDLPAVAAELGRSAWTIIKHAHETNRSDSRNRKDGDVTAQYANDILLLISMRKFCRHIVASAPGTAIAFFSAMSLQKKYRLPATQFATNITTEALLNKDSILYHEDEGFYSGYFGYVRPFMNALYGDFALVNSFSPGNSPLDVNFSVRQKFDSVQLGAYARAVLATFKSAIDGGRFCDNSSVLHRAFDAIENSCDDLYKLNEVTERAESEDIQDRLGVVVSFINKAIELLEARGVKRTRLRRHDEYSNWRDDYYDYIAFLMLGVIRRASSVKTREFIGWNVQYNMVWSEFFSFQKNKTRSIVLFKLRRLLYERVLSIEKAPYLDEGASILGCCLNIMGLEEWKTGYDYQLRRVVISWARRNYLRMVREWPKTAAAVLQGSISFDAENKRLVKTFGDQKSATSPRQYLRLVAPTFEDIWGPEIRPLRD
jgi:hypothetical protein